MLKAGEHPKIVSERLGHANALHWIPIVMYFQGCKRLLRNDLTECLMKACLRKNQVMMFVKCLPMVRKASVGRAGLEPVTP